MCRAAGHLGNHERRHAQKPRAPAPNGRRSRRNGRAPRRRPDGRDRRGTMSVSVCVEGHFTVGARPDPRPGQHRIQRFDPAVGRSAPASTADSIIARAAGCGSAGEKGDRAWRRRAGWSPRSRAARPGRARPRAKARSSLNRWRGRRRRRGRPPSRSDRPGEGAPGRRADRDPTSVGTASSAAPGLSSARAGSRPGGRARRPAETARSRARPPRDPDSAISPRRMGKPPPRTLTNHASSRYSVVHGCNAGCASRGSVVTVL